MGATGAQVVEVKPEQNTNFSDVKLHVLNVPALGYKVVWIGAGKRLSGTGREGRDCEGLGRFDHARERKLRVVVEQAERMHHQPL